jgi:hypothetical protein
MTISNRLRRSWHPGTLFLTLLSLAACDRSQHHMLLEPPPLDVRDLVTVETLSLLDGSGRFRVAAESTTPEHISPDRARELAELHIRIFGPLTRGFLEKRRGETIDFSSLHAASRIYFVSTPFAEVPDYIHRGVRKAYGAYYIVPMIFQGQPEDIVLSVAVSALNTDVIIDGKHMRYAVEHGNDFIVDAVPKGTGITMPVSPEWAAQAVTRVTGAKIAGSPVLEWQGIEQGAPQLALWKLPLDRLIRLRGTRTGTVKETRAVYVGVHGTLQYPQPDQPASVSVSYPVRGGQSDERETLALPVILGRAVNFEPISLIPNH